MKNILLSLSLTICTTTLMARDTTYVFSDLHFQLSTRGVMRSNTGICRVTDTCCTLHYYEEFDATNTDRHYEAQLCIIDMRPCFNDDSTSFINNTWRIAKQNAITGNDPDPDTSASFRGLPAIRGNLKSKTGSGKKIEYQYLYFFYNGIWFGINVIDTRKESEESFEDFISRFQLIG